MDTTSIRNHLDCGQTGTTTAAQSEIPAHSAAPEDAARAARSTRSPSMHHGRTIVRGKVVLPVIERLASKCHLEDRGHTSLCCIFDGFLDVSGYGVIKETSYANAFAHRVMYEHVYGQIPEDMELDHLCRVPACCNPLHLEPVTHTENVRRGRAAEVSRAIFAERTHCKHGHELTPENTRRVARGGASPYMRRLCLTCTRQANRRHDAKRRGRAVA